VNLLLVDLVSSADNHLSTHMTADPDFSTIVRNTQLLLAARMFVLGIHEMLEMTTDLLLTSLFLCPRAEDCLRLADTTMSIMTTSKSLSPTTTVTKITDPCLSVFVKENTLDLARAVVEAAILALLELVPFEAALTVPVPAVPLAAAEVLQ
jgi:hypothetical protein